MPKTYPFNKPAVRIDQSVKRALKQLAAIEDTSMESLADQILRRELRQRLPQTFEADEMARHSAAPQSA